MARRIYVIELDPKAWSEPRLRKANPHITGTPVRCVYVGETSRSPELRFAQHKAGIRANSLARRYGIRLLEHLMQERYWPAVRTTRQAEDAEERRAESLRRRGYAVYPR
jgi:hypothetical protein